MKLRLASGLATCAAAGIAALTMSATIASAQVDPPAGSSAYLVSGCTTQAVGTTCNYVFRFINAVGQGEDGLTIIFSNSGPTGCTLQSTTGTTSGGGYVTATLDCGSGAGTGPEVITAKSGTVSASANPTVVAAAAAGATSGNSGSSSGLPFTGTTPPGPNVGLLLGAGFAAMALVGGGITLARRRAA